MILALGLAWTFSCAAQEPDFAALDLDGSGTIEPTEIPANSLAIVSRYASLAGQRLENSVSIDSLELGRQRYLRSLDGYDRAESVWQTPPGKQRFGRPAHSLVQPFGPLGEMTGPYSDAIRQRALRFFQEHDSNRDGLLSGQEMSFVYRSTSQSWMRGDQDGNGLLNFAELASALTAERRRWEIGQAHQQSTWKVNGIQITPAHRNHAARLMNKFDQNKNGSLEQGEIPEQWKTGNGLAWADSNGDGKVSTAEMQTGSVRFLEENERSQQRMDNPILQHCQTLAREMIKGVDANGDKMLVQWEWQRIGEHMRDGDLNQNGVITEDELAQWFLHRLSDQPAGDLPEDLPTWFVESDANLDGQVLLSEFVSVQPTDKLPAFSHLDRNGDGIVTVNECRRQRGAGKTRYANSSPVIVQANQEASSEIHISEAITIADVDVQVSIVKDGDDDLELRLIGPDGTQAHLYFTSRRKAWGGGRMFSDTLIDDEAPHAAQRLPRPPAHRSFRPQSIGSPDRLSLSAFYGKPARGTWRLTVANKAQNQNNGAGLLTGWALWIKPASQPDAPRTE